LAWLYDRFISAQLQLRPLLHLWQLQYIHYTRQRTFTGGMRSPSIFRYAHH